MNQSVAKPTRTGVFSATQRDVWRNVQPHFAMPYKDEEMAFYQKERRRSDMEKQVIDEEEESLIITCRDRDS